eukprot:374201-Amphidinium_carterae.2
MILAWSFVDLSRVFQCEGCRGVLEFSSAQVCTAGEIYGVPARPLKMLHSVSTTENAESKDQRNVIPNFRRSSGEQTSAFSVLLPPSCTSEPLLPCVFTCFALSAMHLVLR